MRSLRGSSLLVLIVSLILINATSAKGGDDKHPCQNKPHSVSTQEQSANAIKTSNIERSSPRSVTYTMPSARKDEPQEKWDERPSVTDWGVLAVTAIYAFISLGILQATRKQATLMREALVSNKRAFVYADGFVQLFEVDAVTGGHNWRFRPRWRNAGETPTKDLSMYVACEIRDDPLPPGYSFPIEDTAITRAFVGPKTEILGGVAPRGDSTTAITPEHISATQEGKKFIYMWGWVKYRDIFPGTPRHISHFCWAIVITGNPRTFVPNTPGVPPTPHTLSFGSLLHQEGNYAD